MSLSLRGLRNTATRELQAGRRMERFTASGARIQFFAGDDRWAEAARLALDSLARNSTFAALLRDTTLVIAPSDRGVSTIEGMPPGYGFAEGVAFSDGLPATSTPHAAVIRADSVARWNMGIGHELLHLLVAKIGLPARREIHHAWRRYYGPKLPADAYMNQEHLFVFMGQYYLAGYGDLVRQEAPEIFVLCKKWLGDARYAPRTTSRREAQALIRQIVNEYRYKSR